jgi:hypothetical protein
MADISSELAAIAAAAKSIAEKTGSAPPAPVVPTTTPDGEALIKAPGARQYADVDGFEISLADSATRMALVAAFPNAPAYTPGNWGYQRLLALWAKDEAQAKAVAILVKEAKAAGGSYEAFVTSHDSDASQAYNWYTHGDNFAF